ncbi:PrsW family intramembrane metalloprotease [Nocardiopsis flavescens]|uniref:Membrane proteinase PrsW, cleaves anti-sigma factor RsiW, M82 family n=1 Tax=Nocardiopsis flavescens TaxID=758803 RepID=A0A1M6Q108_9ACTN|nr:PrsW family intramembrane metalloprotease [Nocardiopsis flavescens]SHK13853.1 Membrane proteinase PrsW, cleaves anti-sigma factor RsiW, M82 family [Nocardiopsis flavescens]
MSRLDSKAVLQGRRSRHSMTLVLGITVSLVCMAGMLAYLWLLALAGGAAAGIDGATGFVVALVAAVIPAGILVPLILMLDRLEPEPGWVLFFAFVWGAGVAVVAALLLNSWGLAAITVPLFGQETGEFLGTSAVAPLVEESAKGLVLLILLWRRRNEIDTFTDGVVYAGMVATGFAFTENILYFLSAFFDGTLVATFAIRGIVAPFGHPLYTAMIGIGVAYAAMRPGFARLLAPVAGWVLAVLLHGMWNGSTYFGWTGLGLAYLVLFAVLMGILALAANDRRGQVQAIAHYLPPYISTGLVTPADIAMLSTLKGRRSARDWAARNAGARGREAMREYQLAATELALLHQKLDAGVRREDWKVRRDAFLALMHVSRDAFLGRVPQPAAPGWAERPTDSGFLRRADFAHVIAQARAQQEYSPRHGR